ncbi:MAG: hydroxymethylbilane synthase [Syntrophus sp. (in: bacteria)]|nr:hydroxymethylbilane synthase [Syntrophus sp. (in: bacteria)]
MKTSLKIGSRGSALALTQTNWVADRLRERYPEIKIATLVIRTKGDIMQDVSLAKIGGKGVFVKEIEDALLRGDVDIAVHSMKDVPAELPEGLQIATIPEREDPRDVLIAKNNRKIESLPRGARIGTGSLRRGMQMRNLLPDVRIVPLRGNLDTRIRKIELEDLDGIIVAAAGIRRMGWVHRVSQFIPAEVMLPAVGQGALGIEMRTGDSSLAEMLAFLNHAATSMEVGAERSFLQRLGGGCQLPIAAYAKIRDRELTIRGLVGSLDGRVMITDEVRGNPSDYHTLGTLLAERILLRGGEALIDQAYHGGGGDDAC